MGEVRPVSPARWVALTGFALLVASTQLLWLTFAPLTSDAASALQRRR